MSARHPHGYVSALFCAMLLFNLSGCAYIGGAIALAVSGGSSSSRTVGNQAPSVTFMTTPVPQATDLVASVDYDLIDQESGLIDLVVDYSTDGGLTYTPAAEGPGSDGVSDLDSSPTGTPHTYAWNFFSDLFAKDFILLQASSFDVTLRFVSDDGVTRTPMPTDTVSFRVGNRPPTVVLDSVTATPVDPSVEVRFTLLDDFGDPLDLSIEYSLDGFTSPGFPATPLTPPSAGCSDAITGLASSQGGMQHCFEWDYPLDGFSSADGVELRLVVTDPALASSAPVTSAPFRMGNDPPESILSPVDTQFGVRVDFLLIDSTSDTSDITVDYSVDDGLTYQTATSVVGSVAGLATSPQGEPHNVAWNALVDLGLGTFGMVKVRITPCDDPTGAMVLCGSQVETETFSLQNTDRPLTFVTSPQANGLIQNQVPIDYLIVDFDADPMVSILVEYRASGSPTFVVATEGVGGDGTTNLSSSQTGTAHIYMWDSAADIPGQDVSDAELKITPSDAMVGTAALGGPYRVNNNTEPTIQSFPTPPTAVTQNVTLTYDIADPEGDGVDVLVEYSTDGGVTWPNHAHEPPGASSDGIQNLTSSPGGTGHVFVWDTQRDLGAVMQTMVRVRITPSDNVDEDLGLGTLASTTTFVVDNDPSTAPPTIDTISPPQGPSGGMNPVIVTGTGFLQGTTVTIGTQALQGLSLVSTNTVTGNIPPYISGPLSVDVTVDNGNGTATLTAGYTYILGGPIPCMISMVTPVLGTIGGGTIVTIDGSNFRPAAGLPSVLFDGIAATVDPLTTDTQIMCTTPAAVGMGVVDIDIMNSMGDTCMAAGAFLYDVVGVLDISFGGPGIFQHDNAAGGTVRDVATAVLVDASGRIVAAGGSRNGAANDDMVVWRINPDGTLDTTFNGQGFFVHDSAAGGGGFDRANDVALDGSGRILVTGTSQSVTFDMVVWRLNTDGSLDTTFSGQGWVVHDNAAGGSATDQGMAILEDSMGRIVVGGPSDGAGTGIDAAVWRFMPDGTFDTTFNGQGWLSHDLPASGNDSPRGMAIDASGRILLVGSGLVGATTDLVIWRFMPDGTLDATFNGQGWLTHDGAAGGGGNFEGGNAITLDSTGRILATGGGSNALGEDEMVLWAYNTDGTLDTTFNGQGWVNHVAISCPPEQIDNEGRGIVVDALDRIVVAGRTYCDEIDLAIWRFDSAGNFDTTFNGQGWTTFLSSGTTTIEEGNDVVLDGAGRILVAGEAPGPTNTDMTVWRYNSVGTLDATLAPGPGFVVHDSAAGASNNEFSRGVGIDPATGRIVVSGTGGNGSNNDMVVWGWTSGGALDFGFGSGGILISDRAAGGTGGDGGGRLFIDSLGRFYETGNSNGTLDDMVIWRFTAAGVLDTTFGPGTGIVSHHDAAGGGGNDFGRGIFVEPTGRILVAGSSQAPPGLDMVVWAYDDLGNPDPNFNGGVGFFVHDAAAGGGGDDEGLDITMDSMNRILVAGYSTNAALNRDMVVWAFLPNGTLDLTFNGTGFFVHDNAAGGGGGNNDEGLAILVDPGDRILVSGYSHSGGNEDMVVWALNPDGTLDTSFNGQGWFVHDGAAGGSGGDRGEDIILDAVQRIVVTGESSGPTGTDMATWRLDPFGNLDTVFGGVGFVSHAAAAGGASNIDRGRALALDSTGRIIVAGNSYSPVNDDMTVWRYQ